MMAAERIQDRLIDRLPVPRGRLTENAPLAGVTWFRVGGPAEVMFRPVDRDDLTSFLAEKPDDVPVTVIGVGSNILVRDGGIPGVVVRLGRTFVTIDAENSTVHAGAGALCLNTALTARDAAITGLEFLSGVPGTIGGALRMNAGAYGREMTDVTTAAEALDATGGLHRLTPNQLGFSYRHSAVPEDWILISATLQGAPGEQTEIAARIRDISREREDSQPLRTRTGGSTFKNPPGAKAWELIEQAGCRGLRRGGAMVSEKHCNFLINTGEATAADLEELGEKVRRRVHDSTGIRLEWEIRRIGVPATGPGGVQ